MGSAEKALSVDVFTMKVIHKIRIVFLIVRQMLQANHFI